MFHASCFKFHGCLEQKNHEKVFQNRTGDTRTKWRFREVGIARLGATIVNIAGASFCPESSTVPKSFQVIQICVTSEIELVFSVDCLLWGSAAYQVEISVGISMLFIKHCVDEANLPSKKFDENHAANDNFTSDYHYVDLKRW